MQNNCKFFKGCRNAALIIGAKASLIEEDMI